MIAQLKEARELLRANGWSGPEAEPMCLAAPVKKTMLLDGRLREIELPRPCWEWDEGVRRFSVYGALIEAKAWPDGWYLLEEEVAPAHAKLRMFDVDPERATLADWRAFQRLCREADAQPTLEQWLKTWNRTDAEVLRALVGAIQRGKKVGERR